jgi:hypothetical protein
MPITNVTKLEKQTKTLRTPGGISRKEVLATEPCRFCAATLAEQGLLTNGEVDPRYGAEIVVLRDTQPTVTYACRSHAIMLIGNKAVTDALNGVQYQPKGESE